MNTRFVSVLGATGLAAVMWHCGGSSVTIGPQSDASVDGPGSSDASSSDGSPSDGSPSSDSSSDGRAGDSAATTCSPACGMARACCKRGVTVECVNLDNDPQNCGACGVKCGSGTYCDGTCKPIPCDREGGACPGVGTCCGTSCCATGDLCCKSEGPVGQLEPSCFTPTSTQTTCPQGCAPLCESDRAIKTGILPVDEKAILDAISGMPISSWSYKSDPSPVRHIGPMAQDFHAAFGGKTDRAYDPIDAHGAAFASIKALRAMIDEQNARIDRLEGENRALRKSTGATCR